MGTTPFGNNLGVRTTPFVDAADSVPPLLWASARLALKGALSDLRLEPATRAALKGIRRKLSRLPSDITRREVDQLWRALSPEEIPALAAVYGILLLLDEHDIAAAQRLLGLASPNTADVAALKAWTLSRQGRAAEACNALHDALAAFSTTPKSLLAAIATSVVQAAPVGIGGWAARTPELGIIGVLRTDAPRQLYLAAGSAKSSAPLLEVNGAGGFSLPASAVEAETTLALASGSYRLLGRGEYPADFGIDGRAVADGSRVIGWVRFTWHPRTAINLRLTDEHARRITLKVHSTGETPGTARFSVPWPRSGTRLLIEAQDPAGRWQPLPDAPLLRGPALLGPAGSAVPRRWQGGPAKNHGANFLKAPPVDVIVPVYGDRESTLACLQSVRATLPADVQLIILDDATPDTVLAEHVMALRDEPQIIVRRNETNLGFVATINRALTINPDHDAVLLNSDTQVWGDWLPRLRSAAYSGPKVATATPWTNDGTITGYPLQADPTANVQALQQLCAQTLDRQSVEIPVGIGFCLYVRRDALRAVGPFDVASFGSGYGEETDFSLRARALGWSHRLAADVFVRHSGGRSFGATKAIRMARAAQVIERRYPGFHRWYRSFQDCDPLEPLRRRLDAARLGMIRTPMVLLVTLALDGGVARFVKARTAQLRAAGRTVLMLRPAEAQNARVCTLSCEDPALAHLRFEVPRELDEVMTLLRQLPLEAIEIQHFLHHHVPLIEGLRRLGVPYEVFVHDYAWVCPRVTLIDGSGRYCGEPAESVCRICIKRNGSLLGETIDVGALRRRSARWLSGARRVSVPSRDAVSRLSRYFPKLKVGIVPHSKARPVSAPSWPIDTSGPVRVAVLGAIGDHKGFEVLKACARDARLRRLAIEFVVIGYTRDDEALRRQGPVFITGRYEEGEAQSLLRRERPTLALLPSVWPETWSYTLDEAFAAGLFVITLDLGALAERVKATGRGLCLSLNATPRVINDTILSAASRLRGRPEQQEEGMTQDRSEKLSAPAKGAPTAEARKDALSASVQLLPLPPGLYLIGVSANSPSQLGAAGALPLPTLQVSAGPGVGPAQLEFLTAGANESGWLFAPKDLLVVRVKGAGATLALTSVRDPAGEALSVKVEKLDGNASTAAPANLNPAPPALVVATDANLLPLQITAHVRTRGDLRFTDAPWAGRVAPGLWIESFAVRPLAQLTGSDIEYKGLTGNGFETPWISDEGPCGSKGLAVPLVGFAVRLKPNSKAAAAFDCEYSGYFKSGVTVGPLRNGAPCRSTVANDPLEGIQIRMRRRAAGRGSPPTSKLAAKKVSEPASRAKRAPTRAR